MREAFMRTLGDICKVMFLVSVLIACVLHMLNTCRSYSIPGDEVSREASIVTCHTLAKSVTEVLSFILGRYVMMSECYSLSLILKYMESLNLLN